MIAEQPVVVENYFSDEDVATMLRYPMKVQKPAHLPNMEGTFGYATSVEADAMSMENPVTGLTGVQEDDESILKVTEAILAVKKETEKFFGLELSLINCNYVTMLPGSFNPLHADRSELDGTLFHENEETEYSAIIYLNNSGTDYEGGDIMFPLQGKVISPKQGTIIFFKGDYHHPHEVSKVLSGKRRTIVMFFSIKGNVSGRKLFADSHSGVPDGVEK